MSLRIDSNVAINLSLDIINAYCRKDMSFIPVHLDDRTFLIGPRNGQVMRSGEEISNSWISNLPMPDFSVTGIEASSVITGPTSCEVLLRYTVIWHKPDGTTLEHPQVMQVSWFIRQTIDGVQKDSENHDHYKVAVMHISNPEEMDERDLVYNTFGDIATSVIGHSVNLGGDRERWILIPGIGAILNRYPSGSILWIDSAAEGHKSLVHTRDRNIRCSKPISWFMEEYPDVFLKPSASFIVNPAFIKTIQRFQIELWGGNILRVPEKKYMTFKRSFEQYLTRQNKGEEQKPDESSHTSRSRDADPEKA